MLKFGVAFYDFDGTLSTGNVVQRYLFFALRAESAIGALLRCLKMLFWAPALLALEAISRPLFNRALFWQYRGLRQERLLGLQQTLFDRAIRPSLRLPLIERLEADRRLGLKRVLLTGELDVALGPTATLLGFDSVICNSLEFKQGVATGRIAGRLIAGPGKVAAAEDFCRLAGAPLSATKAYCDSIHDLPVLEWVGEPIVVHPDRRLTSIAAARCWPVIA